MFLSNFSDENMHSKIQTSISINASADDIIKQACVIGKFFDKLTLKFSSLSLHAIKA
jgi:hypothetical protein